MKKINNLYSRCAYYIKFMFTYLLLRIKAHTANVIQIIEYVHKTRAHQQHKSNTYHDVKYYGCYRAINVIFTHSCTHTYMYYVYITQVHFIDAIEYFLVEFLDSCKFACNVYLYISKLLASCKQKTQKLFKRVVGN